MGIEPLWMADATGNVAHAPAANAADWPDQFGPDHSAGDLLARGLIAPMALSRADAAALLLDAQALQTKLARLLGNVPAWADTVALVVSALDANCETMERSLAAGESGRHVWDEPDDYAPMPFYASMTKNQRDRLRSVAWGLEGQLRPLLELAVALRQLAAT